MVAGGAGLPGPFGTIEMPPGTDFDNYVTPQSIFFNNVTIQKYVVRLILPGNHVKQHYKSTSIKMRHNNCYISNRAKLSAAGSSLGICQAFYKISNQENVRRTNGHRYENSADIVDSRLFLVV